MLKALSNLLFGKDLRPQSLGASIYVHLADCANDHQRKAQYDTPLEGQILPKMNAVLSAASAVNGVSDGGGSDSMSVENTLVIHFPSAVEVPNASDIEGLMIELVRLGAPKGSFLTLGKDGPRHSFGQRVSVKANVTLTDITAGNAFKSTLEGAAMGQDTTARIWNDSKKGDDHSLFCVVLYGVSKGELMSILTDVAHGLDDEATVTFVTTD